MNYYFQLVDQIQLLTQQEGFDKVGLSICLAGIAVLFSVLCFSVRNLHKKEL